MLATENLFISQMSFKSRDKACVSKIAGFTEKAKTTHNYFTHLHKTAEIVHRKNSCQQNWTADGAMLFFQGRSGSYRRYLSTAV